MKSYIFELPEKKYDNKGFLKNLVINHIAEKYPLEIFDKDFSAAEISAKLQPHFKILSLSALGKALRDLCKREPERFVYNGSQKHPAYKILREPIRAESETTLNEDILKNHSPFEGLSF